MPVIDSRSSDSWFASRAGFLRKRMSTGRNTGSLYAEPPASPAATRHFCWARISQLTFLRAFRTGSRILGWARFIWSRFSLAIIWVRMTLFDTMTYMAALDGARMSRGVRRLVSLESTS